MQDPVKSVVYVSSIIASNTKYNTVNSTIGKL